MATFAAVFHLGGPAHYLHWGWLQISIPNLVLIAVMVVVFVLAIAIPFGRRGRS